MREMKEMGGFKAHPTLAKMLRFRLEVKWPEDGEAADTGRHLNLCEDLARVTKCAGVEGGRGREIT